MRTLFLRLLALAGSAGAYSERTANKVPDQGQLPKLTLPWGTYQAQVFTNDSNIYLFENVRFGAKPQRFSTPSFPSWTNSSIQPTSDGRNCIQIDPSELEHPPGGKKPVDDPADATTKTSEDCLFLDLYVPKWVFEQKNAKPLPVIVWIYGGAFAFGSKNQLGPLYTGQSVMKQSSYKTIFIAGNYRVGAFGWLAGDYMQKAAQPNAGLYDQALLFQWVQKYISQVGGDNNQVTAWGESAGAGSILHHLVREGGTVDPTFKTFAVQSPAFEWAWDNLPGGKLDRVYQNFSKLAGCGLSYDIACLRSSKNLSAANQELFNTVRQTGLFPVGPAVDGKWIKTIPTLSFSAGNFWKGIKSDIVSHCLNEPASFTPKGITTQAAFDAFLNIFLPGNKLASQRDQVNKKYDCKKNFRGDYTACIATVIRDASFTCNTRDLFEAFPTKSHMMKYGFPIPQYARHASDLVALFTNDVVEAVQLLVKNGVPGGLANFYAQALVPPNIARAYQTYFASFALSGDPNLLPLPPLSEGPGPRWPVGNGSGDYLTNVLTVRAAFGQAPFVLESDDQNMRSTCAFWTNLAKEIVAAQDFQLQDQGDFDEL